MKNHILKTLIIFAVCVICLTAFATKADAAETGTFGDGLTWELDEWGNFYIFGYGDMPDFSPEEPAPWMEYLPEDQLSVTVSGDVTSIGAYAFYGYTGALFVHLEDSAVMSIGPYAFYDCQNLFEIWFPESIFTIGEYAFYQCSSMQISQQLDLLISIGNYAFYNCYNLLSLPSGSSLSTIGDYAFAECGSLDTVTFPASVTSIGDGAFAYSSLRTVTFEGNAPQICQSSFDGVTIDAYYDPNTEGWTDILSQNFYGYINWYSIGGAESPVLGTGTCGDGLIWELTKDGVMTISGTGRMTEYLAIDTPWLSLTDQITSVIIENGVEYIGREAFKGCTALSDITAADSVQCIGAYAFDDTAWLSNQPNGIVYIGKVIYTYKGTCPAAVTLNADTVGIAAMAFKDTQTLEQINFPSSLREIGGWAFHNCTALQEIDLNEGLTIIGQTAFAGCNTLTQIIIPDSVTVMGSGAFGSCNRVEKIVIGNGLENLSYSAFSYSAALKEIAFGNKLHTISNSAFRGCTALEYVTLPSTVTVIEDYAFNGCTGLKNIVLSNVSKIGYYAFTNCDSLAELSLPETLTVIDQAAFANCDILSCVTIPDSVKTLELNCFKNCPALKEVNIGKGASKIDSTSFLNCTSLERITVDPENEYYISDECGVLYTKDHKTLLIYPTGRAGAYTVADTVTLIEQEAFANCLELTAVTLPDGLLTLEYGVFANCITLKEIKLPDSVIKTYGGTFSGCTALETVWLGDGLKDISATMFADCIALKEVRLPAFAESIGSSAFKNCASLTSIVLPESLTQIWNEAFSGCTALQNVDLPKNLNQIRGKAFDSCASLQEIYIPDTVVSIDYGVFQSCDNLTTVILPKNLKSIPDHLFYYCKSLTSIAIPETVQKIDKNAFAGCYKLEYVKFTGSQDQWSSVTIGENALPVQAQLLYDYERYGSVDSYGVVLKDNIGLYFQMNLSQEILDDSAAYVTVSFNGKDTVIPASEANEGIALDLAAAQMTVPTYICISFHHGSTGDTMSYTVKQYAQNIMNGNYTPETKVLAAAMLNYGGKAQSYFEYNTENMADADISVDEHAVPSPNQTQTIISGQIDGISFYGASLVYRNKLAVRYYFKTENTPADFQFSFGNQILTPVEKNGMYYVEVADILPQDLDNSLRIQVTDSQEELLQVDYNPMTYISRMYEKGTNSTKALLQALYTYHITARNYTEA